MKNSPKKCLIKDNFFPHYAVLISAKTLTF